MVKFHPPRERWLKKTVTEITDDKQVSHCVILIDGFVINF